MYNKPVVVTNTGGLHEQINSNIANIGSANKINFGNAIIRMIQKINTNALKTEHFENHLEKHSFNNTIKDFSILYNNKCQ